MGLNLDEKKAVVAEVSAQVANAQTIVLADYRGVEVGDLTRLRASARKSGVYLRVLKNTLVRRAVADYGYCVSPDDCYLALRGDHEREINIFVLKAGLISGSRHEELAPDQPVHGNGGANRAVLVQHPQEREINVVRLHVIDVGRPSGQLLRHDAEMLRNILGVDLIDRFGHFVRAQMALVQQHL